MIKIIKSLVSNVCDTAEDKRLRKQIDAQYKRIQATSDRMDASIQGMIAECAETDKLFNEVMRTYRKRNRAS